MSEKLGSGIDISPECREQLHSFYKSINMPLAIISKNLEYVYQNSLYQKLLVRYQYAETKHFLNTFSRVMKPSELSDIYRCLKSKNKHYSWSGLLEHKSRDVHASMTKMQIMPYMFSKDTKEPKSWIVIIDDFTVEMQGFIYVMFNGLLDASKLKDNDTGHHIERVNIYSTIMAKAIYDENLDMYVDIDFVDNIGFLAAMHDVGKIGTPDDILNKNGSLDEFEWKIMKEHTINGAFILSAYPNPMAKEIAQSHHERWDGTGYPYNLEKDMIPLSARIVTIADVYDALRMKRSYKSAMSHEEAYKLIMQGSGSHFDPSLVLVFRKHHKELEKIYDETADPESSFPDSTAK